jgi:hypothetical protein
MRFVLLLVVANLAFKNLRFGVEMARIHLGDKRISSVKHTA